jgi:hypothetical protein
MALQDVWNYDHAPQSATTDLSAGSSLTSYAENGLYNQTTGLPGMLFKNTSGQGLVNTDGFLYLVSSGTYNPALLVQASEVQDWNVATQYWIGFRTKLIGAQNGGTCQMFNISSSLSQSAYTTIIAESDMTAAGANVIGTEYYVEVFIDRKALVYQVWINGAQVKSGALSSAAVWQSGASYYFWGAYNSPSATSGATRCFKNFYFLNVDTQYTPTRLGTIKSTLVPAASASAPNYTPYSIALTGTAGVTTSQAKIGAGSFACGATAGSAGVVQDSSRIQLTGNFTIEAWVYMTSVASDVVMIDKSLNATATNRAWVEFYNQQVYIKFDGSSGATAIGPASGVPGASQWFHFACVKNGTTVTVYINGTSIGSITTSSTWGAVVGGNLVLGQNFSRGAPNFPGYIDELRISTVARYTANFTPSTSPFVSDANTGFLMHADVAAVNGVMLDDSATALEAFTTPYNQTYGATLTPMIAGANNPVTVGYAQPNPASILAVDFRLAGQAPQGVQVAQSLQQGTNTKALSAYTFPDANTAQYGRRLALTQVGADGAVWTPAKLAASQLVLTPNG